MNAKKLSVILSIIPALSVFSHAASPPIPITPEQFASISADLDSRIVAGQTTSTGSYGIRYNNSNYLTAIQTFTWDGTLGLAGIGVKLAESSNNINSPSSYNYQLRVFEVSGLETGAAIDKTLGTYSFSISGDYRTVSDYLYFNLPSSLVLENGNTYAFQITPAGTQSARLTLATSQGGTSTYDNGIGYIGSYSSLDIPATINNTGGTVGDYVFFLTGAAIPEPQTVALWVGGLVLGLACWHRRRKANR